MATMNLSLKQKAEQVQCPHHYQPIVQFDVSKNTQRGNRLVCEQCHRIQQNTIFIAAADECLQEWHRKEKELITQSMNKFNGIADTIMKLQDQLIKSLQGYFNIELGKLQKLFSQQANQLVKYRAELENLKSQRENTQLNKIIQTIQQPALGTTILQDIAIFFSEQVVRENKVIQQDPLSFSDFYIKIRKPVIEKIGWQLWEMIETLEYKFNYSISVPQNANQNVNELKQKIQAYLLESQPEFRYEQQPDSLGKLDSKITTITKSIDDKMVAVGGNDGKILFYQNLNSPFIKLSTQGQIQDLAFSNDDRYLAVSQFSEPFEILLYNLKERLNTTSRPKIHLKGHTGIVWRIQFTLNSNILLSGGRDQTFKIWQIDTQSDENQPKAIVAYEKSFEDSINCVNIAPNQKFISVCCGNGKVYIFDSKQLTKPQQKLEFQAHSSKAYCAVFTQDSTMLLTSQSEIKLWSLNSLFSSNKNKLPLRIFQGVSAMWCIKSEYNGNIVISIDDKIKIWNAQTGQIECQISLPQNYFQFINTKNFVTFQDLKSILIAGDISIKQFRRDQQQ